MKKLGLFLALSLCFAISQAKADTVLTFTGGVGVNNGYPYSFTANTGSTTIDASLMCISDFTNIQGGESWSVNLYTPSTAPIGSSVPGEAAGVTNKDFEEAAYLYNEAVADPGDTTYQEAAWDVMNPSDIGGENVTNSDVTAAILAASTNATAANTGDVTVYIYNGDSITGQVGDDAPQIFLGTSNATPEPSSLLLLGTGMLGLGGFIRRKLHCA